MPEVRRGSSIQLSRDSVTRSDSNVPVKNASQSGDRLPTIAARAQSLDQPPNHRALVLDNPPSSPLPRRSTLADLPDQQPPGRHSISYAKRDTAKAYYDSRAGTHREWERRGKTLQEYYDENPHLLPQLPFTWRHGRKRWKLFAFAFIAFVDASAVPIALYYGLKYAGHVEGWIIFAVVTTIWGGPAYLEAGVRTWRLIKKERFYRPLNSDSRWSFDILTWVAVLTIFVVTTLFVVGSAPHIVFLRVLSMPGPAILFCLGGSLALITIYHLKHWPAPFRISSTVKGGPVLPGAYYFMEDIIAVNAGAGRPYREAIAARYLASPRFRRMLLAQSVFWSVPALILGAALTVVAVIPPVPEDVAYGICWAVPFLWAVLWAWITVKWCAKEIRLERSEWERDETPNLALKNVPNSEIAISTGNGSTEIASAA